MSMIDVEKVLAIIRVAEVPAMLNLTPQQSASMIKEIISVAVKVSAEVPVDASRIPLSRRDDPLKIPEKIVPAPPAKVDPAKPCRRGINQMDDKGNSFPHDYRLGYCMWCNDGLPPAKTEPDPGSNKFENGGEDKIWCDIHGTHILKVAPDGSILNKPDDCPLFKTQEELS